MGQELPFAQFPRIVERFEIVVLSLGNGRNRLEPMRDAGSNGGGLGTTRAVAAYLEAFEGHVISRRIYGYRQLTTI